MSVQTALFAESTHVGKEQLVTEISGAFDVNKFLEKFEVLVAAHGGAEQVRRLVVELAVRGRLTDWQHGDDLASSLSAQIRIEVGERAAKYGSVDPSEAPFEIPSRWLWVRWGHLVTGTSSGWSPQCESRPRGDSEWGVLKVSAVSWNKFLPDENKALPKGVEPRTEFAARAGDFLMSRANTAELVGRSVIVVEEPERLILSDKLVRCEFSAQIEKRYVALFNRSSSARAHYVTHASGTSDSMKNISRDVILAMPIPLPPLVEQKRIVDRVDQLMALCDELEARQNKKREIGTRLTKSALEALVTAEGPEEFDAAWKRVVENFDLLFASAKDVGTLRSLVLELAFRGNLVGPSSSDSPAKLLLGKVEQAWATRKRKEVLPPVEAEERPASPSRWSWIRLGNLAEVVGGVTKGRDLKGRKVRAYPYLRVANVQRGFLDLSQMKEIEIPEDEISKYRLLSGDVLFTEGGDWDKLGRSAIWAAEIDQCIHQNHVFRARLVVSELDSRWFSMFANSPVGRRYFENAAKQTTNLASINMTQLRNCPMPVPPPEEKLRIVARVELLMRMCDALEVGLRRKEERASKLADAVVAELVA